LFVVSVVVVVAVARTAAAKVERGAQWQEGGVAALRLPVFIVESQVVWANSNRHLLPHVVTVAALNVQSASGAFHFYYGA